MSQIQSLIIDLKHTVVGALCSKAGLGYFYVGSMNLTGSGDCLTYGISTIEAAPAQKRYSGAA